MKLITLLIALATTVAFAQVPNDFDTVKAQYDAAVKRALDPLNKTLEQQLKQLLEKVSKTGNVAEIEKITNELKRIADTTTPPTAIAAGDNMSKRFVGKKFKPTSHSNAVFVFKRDGAGEKVEGKEKFPMTWKPEGDFVVATVTGRPGTKPVVWYFRMTGQFTAVMGTDKDDLKVDLTVSY